MTVYYDAKQRTWLDTVTKKAAGTIAAISTLSNTEKQIQRIAYRCLAELGDDRKVEFKTQKYNQVTESSIIFSKSEVKKIQYFPVWAALVFAANGYQIEFTNNAYKLNVNESELIRLYTMMVISEGKSKVLDYLLKV